MATRPERRRMTRVTATIAAMLVDGEGVETPVHVENLSIVGLRATAEHAPAPGTRCRVELRAGNATIRAHGAVVRVAGAEVALRFEQLSFEDCALLRAFLLSHADDPAVVADELSDRLGFLGESA